MLTYTETDFAALLAERLERRRRRGYATPWGKAAELQDYEKLGLAGEVAFANYFGLEIDRRENAQGDGGVDFYTPLGTVDVKTARVPGSPLRFKVTRPRPDYIWLAYFDEKWEQAWLAGWVSRSELECAPLEQSRAEYGGHRNFLVQLCELRTIEEWNRMLKQVTARNHAEEASLAHRESIGINIG